MEAEARADMPMRLIVRAAALVVTSGIAVTALLVGPHGGIPAWGTGLVLSIVILAVAAGAALDMAEWKEAYRGGLSHAARRLTSANAGAGTGTETGTGPGAGATEAAIVMTRRAAAAARSTTVEADAWAATTPLWPLRVCYTLRHKTPGDVLARAFPTASGGVGAGGREAMSRETLDGWLERYSGFGEWPIRRPVEMAIEIDFYEPGNGRQGGRRQRGTPRGSVRFQRLFSDAPVEVKSVCRVDDRLHQDNDVSGWMISNRTGTAWTVADLRHATIRVKTVYLSFDEEDFRQPPRFETLHLCFGDPPRGVFSFTAAQLATPAIGPDPAPLMRGPFFKTLLMEYELSVSGIGLTEQLVPLQS